MTATSAHTIHAPWCGPAEHALTALGEPDVTVGCVGDAITVGGDLSGWWHQDRPWSTPAFTADPTFIEERPDGALRTLDREPTADLLRVVRTLLPAGDRLALVTRALDELG